MAASCGRTLTRGGPPRQRAWVTLLVARRAAGLSEGECATAATRLSPASLARTRRRSGLPTRRGSVRGDRPRRRRQVRMRQALGLPAYRPAATLLRGVPDAVWLRTPHLLR